MSNKTICSCISCKKEIYTNNIHKHYLSKSCVNPKPSSKIIDGKCPHCLIDISELTQPLKASHIRWCDKNPNANVYRTSSAETIRKRVANTDYKSIAMKISNKHKEGVYEGAPAKGVSTRIKNGTLLLTEETKEKIRLAAKNSNHQRVCKSTHTYVDKNGRVFKFDSSWEDALADRLDFLNIEWDRPLPIIYHLDGKDRKYFPDFYLPKYDIYLDPKIHTAKYNKRKN